MDNQNNVQQPQAVYQPFTPQYVPIIKKEYSPLEKKDSRFMLLFLLCAVIFSDFALFKGFHLGFTLSYALIFGVSTAYLWDKNSRPGAFALLCGLISLAGSVTLSLFSHLFVNVIMLVLIAGLFTIYCIGISNSFNNKQGNFKLLFDLFSAALINPLENLSDLFGSVKAGAKKDNKNLSALIGILISLPVLFVIVPLLVSSDAAFEGLVKSIIKNIGVYIAELAVALIVTPLVCSYMYGKRKKLNVKSGTGKKSVKRLFPVSGAVSFLCVISLVYVVYLFSQLAYFFSAFKGILPEGYTHNASVFARRGFFEMFAVVAINIVIISVISAFTLRKNGKASAGVKGISLFISLFSLLMLAIAMQKMRLNIATYGYSRNRLLVCAFMLMMLVVIAFFIIHIFAPKVPYMQTIIIVCSVIYVALSFADINAVTASYNVNAYNEGKLKSVNVEYLADLGDSTVPELIKLTESDSKKTAARAEIALIKYSAETARLKDGAFIPKHGDFRYYVKVRSDASKALSEYYASLSPEKKKDFDEKRDKFKNNSFEYDEEEKRYFDWEHDASFKYNPKTESFEYSKEE
ncbi:MAG: DUF4173 domain-containing protein [Eubacterium sp.]|nr:DUF4173 domain-containing protein [Eubacterium sp.]